MQRYGGIAHRQPVEGRDRSPYRQRVTCCCLQTVGQQLDLEGGQLVLGHFKVLFVSGISALFEGVSDD